MQTQIQNLMGFFSFSYVFFQQPVFLFVPAKTAGSKIAGDEFSGKNR